MVTPWCRRFDLRDAAIVSGAVALTVSLQPDLDNFSHFVRRSWASDPRPAVTISLLSVQLAIPPWLALTASHALMLCRHPRPWPPESFEQPGVMATIYALLGIITLGPVIFGLSAWEIGAVRATGDIRWFALEAAASSVAGTWIRLRRRGRWWPNPGWIERVGRAIGWGWITLLLVFLLARTFET